MWSDQSGETYQQDSVKFQIDTSYCPKLKPAILTMGDSS
jgi:hypothetical protein